MKVTRPFPPARGKQPDARDLDLRDQDDVSDLLRYFGQMSDIGLRDVLKSIQSQPAYVQNWDGTKKVLIDLRRRLGVIIENVKGDST